MISKFDPQYAGLDKVSFASKDLYDVPCRVLQGAMNMKCLTCAADEMIYSTLDVSYIYKGELAVIPSSNW